MGQLTTGLAIARLTWDCHDLQDQLAAAAEGNQHLTDEARRAIEKLNESLGRELRHVADKIDVKDKFLKPALDELMQEYAAVQSVATRAGLRAPSQRIPSMPYRTQMPVGYGH